MLSHDFVSFDSQFIIVAIVYMESHSVECFLSNDEDRISVTMLKYSENLDPPQRQDEKRGWWCIFGVSLVFVSSQMF